MSTDIEWDDGVEWDDGPQIDNSLTPIQKSALGVIHGAADPAYGMAQLVGKALKGVGATDMADSIALSVAKREEEFQKQTGGESGGSRLLGAVLSPANMIPGAVLAAPTGGAISTGLKYAGSGAVSGAMQPVTGGDDFWEQKAEQTGAGAVAGVAIPAIFSGMANLVKQGITKETELLQNAGVKLTPGQALGGMAKATEDKLISMPLMGDAIRYSRRMGINEFNKAAYNRALAPIGAKEFAGEVGPEGMKYVRKALGDAYDQILPNIGLKLDGPIVPPGALPQNAGQPMTTVRQELNKLRQMAATALPGRLLDDFDNNILGSVINNRTTPQGNMNGFSFKEIESHLTKEISSFAKSQNPFHQRYADMLREARDILREGLEVQNPGFSKELAAINEGWANYAILRQAAAQAKGEPFTPAQLGQAVATAAKRGGQAAGQRKLAERTAMMQDLSSAGQSVLPSKIPDSGTAGRMLLDTAAVGAGVIKPGIPITLGAASLPYVHGGRQLTDALLRARKPLSGALSKVAPISAPMSGAFLGGLYDEESVE